jgi:hypothetical protein
MACVVIGVKLSTEDLIQLYYRSFPSSIVTLRAFVQRKLQNIPTDPQSVNQATVEFILDQEELFTKHHKDLVIMPYTEVAEFTFGICIADEEDDFELVCSHSEIENGFQAARKVLQEFGIHDQPNLYMIV